MISWGQLIWIFFPIPSVSLVLLSIPGPPKLARFGTTLVHRLFFAKITIGPAIRFRLLWMFSVASIFIFAGAVQKLHLGGVCHGPMCKMHSESIWYEKAILFRAERNFWLSLFNLVLWYMVWRVYSLKKYGLDLRDRIKSLESQLTDMGTKPTNENEVAPPAEGDMIISKKVPKKEEVPKKDAPKKNAASKKAD